ncbi:aldehyde dehydrogenase family protein [Tistrella sp. BH-R2-4]|uniref:Aldehyde dehydrogenase family protein n=1 Tax=Tistrella arctica TaxID=3133430 RepID=A0ABU9YNK0_9PROT
MMDSLSHEHTAPAAPDAGAPPGALILNDRIARLDAASTAWARTTLVERIGVIEAVRDALMAAAEDWVQAAATAKQLTPEAAALGEEWQSGPYALMSGCNDYLHTLRGLAADAAQGAGASPRHLRGLKTRALPNGQLAVEVLPATHWDKILFSGVKAEVWMRPGVTAPGLKDHVAASQSSPAASRSGRVSLVLGAGNITAIAPLDCLHKLLIDHAVVVLKLNPVLDAMKPVLERVFAPLIARDALAIVAGDGALGAWLCRHPRIACIHVTGSAATWGAIVWGCGATGQRNRAADAPANPRPVTAELGCVSPTIVVPGPWSAADIAFQAENIASQKLHNGGFNCIACQMLVLPQDWPAGNRLLAAVERVMAAAPRRALWYPGAAARIAAALDGAGHVVRRLGAGTEGRAVVEPPRLTRDRPMETDEVFAPVLAVTRLPFAPAAGADGATPAEIEAWLRRAITWSNDRLSGTLGANILIHPRTAKALGPRFDALLADLHYGCIAVNAWSGLGFLLARTPWGAFNGGALDAVMAGRPPADPGSGIGFVHNTLMFDAAERAVVTAPFRPFPRGLLSGSLAMLPRPPWFVTHGHAAEIGRRLTRFAYRPGWRHLPRIMAAALRG